MKSKTYRLINGSVSYKEDILRKNKKSIKINFIENNKNLKKKMILTAGPSVSSRELVYTLDAALNGWNENMNYYIIKSILPSMIKNRSGCIIGISSVVAFTGNAGQANYTASKSAMISMYKSIALEVAQRNIRINLIAPGFIKTPMTDKLNDNQVGEILKKIPMNRMGSPKEIANIAVFLSSDEASYITGQTFHVNGGMLMV